jgi:nucleoside-diphosphate-sugar epimerase
MAKILVTGGAGFIGSHVVDLFPAKGRELGGTPTVTLEQGLEKTVAYLRDSEQIR